MRQVKKYKYDVWLNELKYLRNRFKVRGIDHLVEFDRRKGKVRVLFKSKNDAINFLRKINE
jgi:hypothetical protein